MVKLGLRSFIRTRFVVLIVGTLIVGTLNLLSEDHNPWQFEPPTQQLESRVGRAASRR